MTNYTVNPETYNVLKKMLIERNEKLTKMEKKLDKEKEEMENAEKMKKKFDEFNSKVENNLDTIKIFPPDQKTEINKIIKRINKSFVNDRKEILKYKTKII